MQRVLIAALTAALLLGITAAGLPGSSAEPRPAHLNIEASRDANAGPCTEDRYKVQPAMGLEKVRGKVAALIRCVVSRWDVDGGPARAIAIADCESSLWPWSGTWNLGVYQHAKPYWIDRVDRWLRESWFNPQQWDRLHTVPQGAYLARANVIVAIRMSHSGGWGPWACG